MVDMEDGQAEAAARHMAADHPEVDIQAADGAQEVEAVALRDGQVSLLKTRLS